MSDNDDEAVRQHAYRIWEREGRPEGQHESHWHQALKELGLIKPHEPEPGSMISRTDPQPK